MSPREEKPTSWRGWYGTLCLRRYDQQSCHSVRRVGKKKTRVRAGAGVEGGGQGVGKGRNTECCATHLERPKRQGVELLALPHRQRRALRAVVPAAAVDPRVAVLLLEGPVHGLDLGDPKERVKGERDERGAIRHVQCKLRRDQEAGSRERQLAYLAEHVVTVDVGAPVVAAVPTGAQNEQE